jgi:hypothetical protein
VFWMNIKKNQSASFKPLGLGARGQGPGKRG